VADSGIKLLIMQIRSKPAALAAFCALLLSVASAQQAAQENTPRKDSKNHSRKADHALTADDGMSVISAALDAKVRRDSAHDCSHLVHTIYERAGFSYTYASSDDLYDGVEGFRRVSYPQPGDLIVWRGHVGIVVQPSRHVFFSFLTAGPGTDDYYSRYWVARGEPRFYRYIKGDRCPGCASITALQQAR
jgi:cell wall-associated NlpC family hydrolase